MGIEMITRKEEIDSTIERSFKYDSKIVIEEMVDMITITRAYEAGQKTIQTVDNTLNKAVNEIGKV